MVALNMAVFVLMSLLLGVAFSNNIIQLSQEFNVKVPAHGGCGCHDCPHIASCDPCCKDPPEVCTDPLKEIPSDDPSLSILVQLSWPRRDVHWFIEAFQKITLETKHRKKRHAGEASQSRQTGKLDGRFRRQAIPTSVTTSEFPTTEFTTETAIGPTTANTDQFTPRGTTKSTTDSIAETKTDTTIAPTTDGTTTESTTDSTTESTMSNTIAPTTDGTTTESTTDSTTESTMDTTNPPATDGTTTESTTDSTTETTTASTTKFTTKSTIKSTTENTTPRRTIVTPTPPDLSVEDKEIVGNFSKEARLDLIVAILEQDITREITVAVSDGEDELAEKDKMEIEIRDANITFDANSPTLKHQLAFGRTDDISTTNARLGTIIGGASLNFVKTFSLPSVSTVGLQLIPPITDCELSHFALLEINKVQCPDLNNPYRTLDGSCNNFYFWLWGKAFTPYRRDLPPVYDNGISTFRKAVSGQDLPSARLISTTVNTIPSEESKSYSILHMTFGQLVDHDIIATPLARASFSGYGGSNSPIKCCDFPKQFIQLIHPQCAPISIPADDPFYKCYDQDCMEFVRSAPAGFCQLSPRQQINQHSAYIDGSVIYGVKTSGLVDLRTYVHGLLKGQVVQEDQMLLPRSLNPDDECNTAENMANEEFCFKAGDGRVNEQILLTFFQTLWAREHNRIARILKENNPDWDDETLFQETRRIIGAEFQQVTYNEYLPTVIGPTLMATSNLNTLKGKHQTIDYDWFIDAGIANSFSTAAYRFGHSLIADNMLSISKHGKVKPKELSTLFFNPFDLYKNGMCDLARGGTDLPENNMDPYFTLEIAGKLFRGPKPFGLDLLALNIQRGRDHGLAPYNIWRKFCGLPEAQDFDDLLPQMTEDRVEALKLAYQNVNDIDLYIGGVSETAIPGAVVGHTFSCIIHNQFLRIKRGDRYWFEYKDGPGAFTPAQIKELHRVTLARIMCNNLPELEYIQRWPLRNPGPDNPKVCCKSIRQYDLDPWKDDYMEEEEEEEEDEDYC